MARDVRPLILPLGDTGLLVRFGTSLSEAANHAAIDFGRAAETAALPGVVEVVPNLVSVLLRYSGVSFEALSGAVRLLLAAPRANDPESVAVRDIGVRFDGPDLAEVAALTGHDPDGFVAAHNAAPLRVLATGFAPGFVYCGFHPAALVVPRRTTVRRGVPAGSVLFAAGQTAITATEIPTGWHLIGRAEFRNFDPSAQPPTTLAAGDSIRLTVL
jgi:KipI family sensor histidine kinase inhibitor